MTYQVKVDTANPPVATAAGCSALTNTTCDPTGALVNSTTYYWQVVATDNHAAATTGPVWSFTTEALPPYSGSPIRVTTSGSTEQSSCGGTWATACTLQTAIAKATSGQEIWVAAGTHTPGASQSSTFVLKEGVAIYGGFAGNEVTFPTTRDFTANETVLSGDLGNNDSSGVKNDNSYTVVTGGSNITRAAVLDGFTIKGGNNTSTQGAGMHLAGSNPALANLIFRNNATSQYGGGLHVTFGSPSLTNVTFDGNSAGVYGGGMRIQGAHATLGSPVLTNVTFANNFMTSGASRYGGGLYVSDASPTLTDVTFSGNSASAGGGMYSTSSNPTLTDATFTNNSAGFGGGINVYSGSLSLTNGAFSGNSGSTQGGGFRLETASASATLTNISFGTNTGSGSALYNQYGTLTITNSIWWNSTVTNASGSPVITSTYNSFAGAAPGNTNHNVNLTSSPF
ncbi:MAG: hypothetical protein ACYC4L_08500, partial [Chloroflexota bacterium]